MSRERFVLDLALTQLIGMDAPTVIVPVAHGGEAGVFCASYRGDADGMTQARAEDNQAEVAAACCTRADADARARCRVHASIPGGRR